MRARAGTRENETWVVRREARRPGTATWQEDDDPSDCVSQSVLLCGNGNKRCFYIASFTPMGLSGLSVEENCGERET